MILVIDNYDSFTYNIVQYLGELGAEITVRRNDAISLDEIEQLAPSHIVISPGPGEPQNAGICVDLIRRFGPHIPILGVCLGHQAIGQAFGGHIVRAKNLMHGKVSPILHEGQGIFSDIPSPFVATRYHSLVVDEPLPDVLEATARTPQGELMGLRHRQYPVYGVQFHPESILTEHGHQLLRNFLESDRLIALESEMKATQSSKMSINGAIAKAIRRQNLSETEAEAAMAQIMEGQATPSQIGAFLTALRMKGESVAEITGCARAMRQSALPVRPQKAQHLIDTCGTGGDSAGTFNISTTAAFVVAGAGLAVAKHGNRSVSSKCGSADVLEALGVNLNLTPDQIAACIDEVGIGFLFAQKLHPAMKHAGPTRRELGVRTVFNLLGPLTNPAGAKTQLMGVYDGDLVETIARVLNALGSEAAFVVHGAGGLDELTTTGKNKVCELRNGQVLSYTLEPGDLGFRRASLSELRGGDAQENALITRRILNAELKDARRDVVLLNAAAALAAGGVGRSLTEGLGAARQSLDSGAALNVMENLIRYSQEIAEEVVPVPGA